MEIIQNKTKQILSEKNKLQAPATNKEQDNFGYRSSSIPESINNFSYSKKDHIKFFSDNLFDYELFGENNPSEEIDINKYQSQLSFFYIKKFIPRGSKILFIGKESDFCFNKIAYNTDCSYWILDNPDELTVNPQLPNFNIKKYLNPDEKNHSFYGFFDFIFSMSGFDNLNIDRNENLRRNLIYNLDRLLKPGGLYNIHFSLKIKKEKLIFNNLIFSFYKSYCRYTIPLFTYLHPLKAFENDDILLCNISEINYHKQNLENQIENTGADLFSFNILFKKQLAGIALKTEQGTGNYLRKMPAYFFHHLIKCGGSSLGAIMRKWFQFENDLYDKVGGTLGFDYEGDINMFKKYKFNIENIHSETCIRGHFQHEGIFIEQRYPEIFKRPDEFKVFTFVRDPFKVLLSLYYFGKKRDYDYQTITLKQFLQTTKNFLAYLLNCNESNYKEILDRYFFIGIVDKMQESFDKFADILGKRKIRVPMYNTTEKDSQVENLEPEFIEYVKKLNELDYKIYNYCLDKFEKM